MNFPNWLRCVWWSLLLLAISVFLYFQTNGILAGDTSTVDVIMLVFWIALVSLPIVSEVNIFGFGLKNKIEQVESNIRNELSTLKLDLNNVLNSSVQANQSFTLNMAPTTEDLEKLTKTLERINKKSPKPPKENTEEYKIPEPSDDIIYLMNVRYALEVEIRRIFFELTGETLVTLTPSKIIRTLQYQYGVLQFPIADIFQNIYGICSAAIHGENIEGSKIDFVKRFAPKVIAFLKKVTAENPFPQRPDTRYW